MNIVENPWNPWDPFGAGKRRAAELEEERGFMRDAAEAMASGMEFKIVRSQFRSFRKPEVLERVLREERENGWELLQKLDDGRIRLSRLRPDNRFASANGIDPYRCVVGDDLKKTMIMLVLVAVAAGVILYQLSRPG